MLNLTIPKNPATHSGQRVINRTFKVLYHKTDDSQKFNVISKLIFYKTGKPVIYPQLFKQQHSFYFVELNSKAICH